MNNITASQNDPGASSARRPEAQLKTDALQSEIELLKVIVNKSATAQALTELGMRVTNAEYKQKSLEIASE